MVSRTRSCERLDHLAALAQARAHEPPRRAATRRAAGADSPALAAAPTVDTGSGRPPTATISSMRRASSGRRAARSAEHLVQRDRRARPGLARRPMCALAPRASSSIKNGLPPDSRAMPSAIACADAWYEPRSVGGQAARIVERRAVRPCTLAHLGALGPPRAQLREEGARRRPLPCGTSSRSRIGGAAGGRISSTRSAALSVSPHCTSSMKMTTRLPRREGREELAQGAERPLPDDLRVADRPSRQRRRSPGTRRSTGKRCASAQTSAGQRRAVAVVDRGRIRCRLSASITLSIAL